MKKNVLFIFCILQSFIAISQVDVYKNKNANDVQIRPPLYDGSKNISINDSIYSLLYRKGCSDSNALKRVIADNLLLFSGCPIYFMPNTDEYNNWLRSNNFKGHYNRFKGNYYTITNMQYSIGKNEQYRYVLTNLSISLQNAKGKIEKEKYSLSGIDINRIGNDLLSMDYYRFLNEKYVGNIYYPTRKVEYKSDNGEVKQLVFGTKLKCESVQLKDNGYHYKVVLEMHDTNGYVYFIDTEQGYDWNVDITKLIDTTTYMNIVAQRNEKHNQEIKWRKEHPYDSITDFCMELRKIMEEYHISDDEAVNDVDEWRIKYTEQAIIFKFDKSWNNGDGLRLNDRPFVIRDVECRINKMSDSKIGQVILKVIDSMETEESVTLKYPSDVSVIVPLAFQEKLKKRMIGEQYILKEWIGHKWVANSKGSPVRIDSSTIWVCDSVYKGYSHWYFRFSNQSGDAVQVVLDGSPLSPTYLALDAFETLAERKESAKYQQQELENRKKEMIRKYGKYFGPIIAQRKVKIGMTKKMCIDSWGEPSKINKTIGSFGVQEQWVYGSIEASYLYFENGKLTFIQN